MHSFEELSEFQPKRKTRNQRLQNNILLKSAVVALVLLLATTSALAASEYTTAQSLQNSISKHDNLVSPLNSTIDQPSEEDSLVSQLNSTVEQRDTLIMQLDTALSLEQSRLRINLPNGSRYLTTLPDANNNGSVTKIFLESTAAWYHYRPAYPFDAPLSNDTEGGYFSSQRAFELTDNRSISLSFWGWTIGDDGNYSYVIVSGNPCLMIGVTVRNDYTAADAGNGSDPNAPIGNSTPYSQSLYHLTPQYVSFVKLNVNLISQNGSIIQADEQGIQSPTPSGGNYFPLGSGETKQIVFYLYPSSLEIAGYEIYVSYLSSVPQLSIP